MMAPVAYCSQLVNDRIVFDSYMGYIVEKFVVPDGKNCMVRLETYAMDKDGIYSIAIVDIPDSLPLPTDPEILYQTKEIIAGNSGKIELDLNQTSVTPGQDVMLNAVYLSDTFENFSVPVKPGGTEIGHNDIDDPFATEQPEPISEVGYTAFTIYYGCDTTCMNTAPQFNIGNDILANAGKEYIYPNWVTDISSGISECEAGQNLNFILTLDNDTGFIQKPQVDPATGDLKFETSSDIQKEFYVTIVLKDDGGTEDSGTDTSDPQIFTISVTIPGNIDGDERVTLKDAVLAMKILSNIPTSGIVLNAEINDDKRIGLEEVIYILKTISGI